jgi:hypothetical protein
MNHDDRRSCGLREGGIYERFQTVAMILPMDDSLTDMLMSRDPEVRKRGVNLARSSPVAMGLPPPD